MLYISVKYDSQKNEVTTGFMKCSCLYWLLKVQINYCCTSVRRNRRCHEK